MVSDRLMALEALVTVGDWIRYVATQFNTENLHFGHGFETAWDEAVQLVLTTLRLETEYHPQILHCRLLMAEREAIMQLVEQRVQTRLPLAYLLKQAWFCGLSFYVDPRVLIPRSPIGEWIERQFVPWVVPEEVNSILDIGTGSGCIAIAAAVTFSHADVDAVDASPDALAVAAMNVERYHLSERVHLLQSDCFSALEGRRYDLIMSNPPYVSQEELADLPAEYQYEPNMALYAAEDGLAIVAKILAQAPHHLTDQGVLVIEVGCTQAAFCARFPNLPVTWLDLERGGEGVFLLTAGQLREVSIV